MPETLNIFRALSEGINQTSQMRGTFAKKYIFSRVANIHMTCADSDKSVRHSPAVRVNFHLSAFLRKPKSIPIVHRFKLIGFTDSSCHHLTREETFMSSCLLSFLKVVFLLERVLLYKERIKFFPYRVTLFSIVSKEVLLSFEPGHNISCNIAWVPSEDSDQPVHPRSLRVSAVI